MCRRKRDRLDTRAIAADSLGRFSVESLEPGAWLVGALHTSLDSLAVDELTARVEVKAKGTSRVLVLGPSMVGFEERRQRGFGKFRGPDELDERFESQTSDFFTTMAGVRVVPGSAGERVLLRGDFRGFCVPTVFIDGMRILNVDGQETFNDYVSPMEIRAIEVYVSAVTRPPEFTMGSSTCGSIVIWTGPRR